MVADFFRLEQRLRQATHIGIAPAIAIGVSRGEEPLKAWYAGQHSDVEPSTSCGPATIFDLASLTKPLTTTLWCLRLVEQGVLDLDQPIGTWLDLKSEELAACPLWRLLNHTSGLPAHRRYFEGLGPGVMRHGKHQQAKQTIRRMAASTEGDARSGDREIYSDIGYLALEWICESIGRPLEDEWSDLPGHGAKGLHFRSVGDGGESTGYAATERCQWRGQLIQGEVHDDNCWTMGGVAGHAGLFGTLEAVHTTGQQWLNLILGRHHNLGLSEDLIARVLTHRNMHANGTRVLGWDTPTPGGSSSGRYFGRSSIGHLGFTGTSLWIDPESEVVITLLSNRVCPDRTDIRIRTLRPELHDLVWQWAHGENK